MADGQDTDGDSPNSATRGPFGAFSSSMLDALLYSDYSDSDTYSDYDISYRPKAKKPNGDGCSSQAVDSASCEFSTHRDSLDGEPCEVEVVVGLGSKRGAIAWMDKITATCIVDGQEVGHLYAILVKKEEIRQNFWDAVREVGPSLHSFPESLFDRFGRLQTLHTTHPLLKGTGVWGSEVNTGNILLLHHFQLDIDWRRKGLGSLLLKHVRQKVYASPEGLEGSVAEHQISGVPGDTKQQPLVSSTQIPTFEIVYPYGGRNPEEVKGMTKLEGELFREKQKLAVIQFFRSHGFRRVGRSGWFAYTVDTTHPSRHLHASLDIDLVRSNDPRADETQAQYARPMAQLRRESPLEYAALKQPDLECLTLFRTRFPHDSPHWAKSDELKDNILHHAAMSTKPRSVWWIMQHVDSKFRLSSTVNVSDLTPLDLFTWIQEQHRCGRGLKADSDEFSPLKHDEFAGYSDKSAQVLAALHGFDPLSPTQVRRFKYGCTCLECIGGVISPQLRVVLLSQAQVIHKYAKVNLENGPAWTEAQGPYLKFVTASVRGKMSSSRKLRDGFVDIFSHLIKCLDTNTLPSIQAIKHNIKISKTQESRNYLCRGGNVEDVLRVVFVIAKSQCALAGNGMGLLLYGDKLKGLKECRNDGEYSCAALACGIENL